MKDDDEKNDQKENIKIDLYQVLSIDICFEHIKTVYEQQVDKFRDLDSKSSNLINTIAAVITLILLSFAYIYGNGSLVKTKVGMIISLVPCSISLILLLFAGWKAITAFQCTVIKDIASPNSTLKVYYNEYRNQDRIRILENLAVSYSNASSQYNEKINQKAEHLLQAQKCMRLSLLFIVLFMISIIVNAL